LILVRLMSNRHALDPAFVPGLMDKLAAMTAATSAETIRVLGFHRNAPSGARTTTSKPDDAYLVLIHLRACPRWRLQADGAKTPTRPIPEGGFTVHDLRQPQAVDFDGPVHLIGFHLPRSVLRPIAAQLGRPETLEHVAGRAYSDPQVRDLGRFLRAASSRRMGLAHPFVESLAQAICVQIVERGPIEAPMSRGGLAPWQEMRAKEALIQDYATVVRVDQLAAACRLSPGQFARAFKQTTGLSPQKWRTQERVIKAKRLLQTRSLSLTAISCDCGFTDQSHFTRTFTEIVGVPPGRWRQTQDHPSTL
jgi:AraC family transcriptional regulator